jgi:hypothetical protein
MRSLLISFTISLYFMLVAISAQAQLQVFPLRTVLTETERVAQLSLRHNGEQAKTYKISTIFYRMHPDGSLEKVTEAKPEEKSAAEYFRFSPKQVILEPDKEQVVRLMLRKPADLAEGDYRAHLYFEEAEDQPGEAPEALKPNETKTLIKARLAIGVPVVVRIGKPVVQVEISELTVEKPKDTEAFAQFKMKSTGSGIAYGNFRTFLTTPKGERKEFGKVVGVSSYIPERMVNFPLKSNDIPAGSKLELEFYENSEIEDEAKVLAQTNVTISK